MNADSSPSRETFQIIVWEGFSEINNWFYTEANHFVAISDMRLKRASGCWLIKDFLRQLCKVTEDVGFVWHRRVVSEEEYRRVYRERIMRSHILNDNTGS